MRTRSAHEYMKGRHDKGSVTALPACRAGPGGADSPGADRRQRGAAITLVAWLPTALAVSRLPAIDSEPAVIGPETTR
jgi:hypothetical protein